MTTRFDRPRRVSSVDEAVAAIRAGALVVIPTDTVYGLACNPDDESAVRALSVLKRRATARPIALVAASLDRLFECVPELDGEVAAVAKALFPGPFTLVCPNRARRYPWLAGTRPGTIGVRVPAVGGAGRDVLDQVGAVAATSANRHGDADPRRLDEVPEEILDVVAAVVEGGALPGAPSTVLDLTGPQATVLREGAVSAGDALARVAAALSE